MGFGPFPLQFNIEEMMMKIELEAIEKRLLRLAKIIETLEFVPLVDYYENEDMGFTMEAVNYACGSPACIIGWYKHLNHPDENFKADIENLVREKKNFQERVYVFAYNELTAPINDKAAYNEKDIHSSRFISPKRAAKTIRNFVETGVVDWDNLNN